ncbi:MAG: ferritin [Thermoleophilaceae bacterium]
MPAQQFVEELNAQIGRELAAAQQYVAAAVFYDDMTLARLAAFFYEQSAEERTHAMMMVQYLLDGGVRPTIAGVAAPLTEFDDWAGPIVLALEQERAVTDQISNLAAIARNENDYLSEQFMQWFLKEQVEEVATMSDLAAIAERCSDRPMDFEDYLARERSGGEDADPTAPPVAGGG